VHNAPEGALYTLHRRTCYAFMPLLLAPIGFCIALLARDRGRAMALVIGLVPLVVFYVADVLSAKILRATDWPPIGWLPAALLLLLGAPFCWRTLRL
jgi:lipopolysaccharide export LptBFGC system permease protein LptF